MNVSPGHRKLRSLLYASIRDEVRWALGHLYSLLILGPLVLGMIYLTLARAASYGSALSMQSDVAKYLLTFGFLLFIVALNLTRVAGEIYHVMSPSRVAEWSPLSRQTNLHFAILIRIGRTTILWLVLFVVCALRSQPAGLSQQLIAGSLFILLFAVVEIYAALNWVHWLRSGNRLHFISSSAIVVVTALPCALLLPQAMKISAPHQAFNLIAALVSAQRGSLAPTADYALYALAGFSLVCLYVVTWRMHEKWRNFDIDYVAAPRRGIAFGSKFNLVLKKRLNPSVAAMVARDLRLTLRAFSSVVYVAEFFSGIAILFMCFVLVTNALPPAQEFLGGLKDVGWLSETWYPAALTIKLTCVLVCSCVGCLVPVLVHYQLAHIWVERATGARASDLLGAKLWLARLSTLPFVIVAWAVGVGACSANGVERGLPLGYVAPLLVECLMLWWLVSSIAGALAFEMPDRPELAVVFIFAISLSLGALGAMLWVMGFALYGLGIEHARDRAAARAHSLLMLESL